jgi:hypothetical protein
MKAKIARKRKGRPHHSPIQGGRPKTDAPLQDLPERARNRSWQPGRKGQGGEGFSQGYGGSEGSGTGASGPDRQNSRQNSRENRRQNSRQNSRENRRQNSRKHNGR